MVKRINLALQGGGAHGAFTWGVLDRILEEDGIEIAAISGTSAGALNGAAVKAGILADGNAGAREMLDWVWTQVASLDDMRMPAWMQAWLPSPGIISKTLEYSLPYMLTDTASRMVSPYAWGPFYKNPLQPIVEKLDFGRVCADAGPRLCICATSVRDGKIRVFTRHNISTEAILASACLPTMFQAVEVEDPVTGVMEAFWDGGYTGNPALFPLFERDLPDDIVIININPLHRQDLPVTPPEIQNRINEISFNSSLLRELRAIDFVQRLLVERSVPEGTMKRVLVHMISDDGLMNDLSVATKLVAVPSVIAELKAAGRRAAGDFLRLHYDDIGERQTVDLRSMFG
ncbi:patatin-like phospholipase family protein [Allosediminivita pacifica]|uniref:NTE family protein n=1 Tax=Allosediminivita pacifica TaxID=1267769 RepID=A0A2T6AW20_9RHOB|nr:patatin-like phospholipase family protein [Allosediminivita pacifica]PTX48009.1 NTE family protein [Allosediminivita pacifica]GGB11504.1 alpha/beta hydrolase [Allosediminivita pacifica]